MIELRSFLFFFLYMTSHVYIIFIRHDSSSSSSSYLCTCARGKILSGILFASPFAGSLGALLAFVFFFTIYLFWMFAFGYLLGIAL